MKDLLDGVVKVKKIMSNKTVYQCRTCGMSHARHREAKDCCVSISKITNKSGQPHQKWRNQ